MKIPNGPKLPSLLQTLYIIAQPTRFLETCAQKYGCTFTLRLFSFESVPVVFFSHPHAIEKIVNTEAEKFEWGKLTTIFQPLTGAQSLILLDNQHQEVRHLLMPPLHGKRLHTYGQSIVDIAQTEISRWQVGTSVCIRKAMSNISLEVILRVVFGLKPGTKYTQLKHLLEEFLDGVSSPLNSLQCFWPFLQQDWGSWSPWGKFLRQRQQIDDLIYTEIASRRHSKGGEDILSLLMAAYDSQNQPLTDVQLRDQLMTLLLLGHETTASALAWAFYWSHRHSSVQNQLQQELARLDEPEPMAIAKLPYLNAVCSETLRITPIALISQPRLLKEPLQLEGYQLEPGTVLVPCIYLAHHRQETYPNPNQFKPERFLDHQFSAYQYLPFGGGSRSCIGMALSLFEMKLVLATVLSRYQLTLARPSQPVRRGITIVPSGGSQMNVIRALGKS